MNIPALPKKICGLFQYLKRTDIFPNVHKKCIVMYVLPYEVSRWQISPAAALSIISEKHSFAAPHRPPKVDDVFFEACARVVKKNGTKKKDQEIFCFLNIKIDS